MRTFNLSILYKKVNENHIPKNKYLNFKSLQKSKREKISTKRLIKENIPTLYIFFLMKKRNKNICKQEADDSAKNEGLPEDYFTVDCIQRTLPCAFTE